MIEVGKINALYDVFDEAQVNGNIIVMPSTLPEL